MIVPNLKGKSIETVQIELNDNDLMMAIQDSANFNPKYPKYSVIEQKPAAGSHLLSRPCVSHRAHETCAIADAVAMLDPWELDRAKHKTDSAILRLGLGL